MVMMLKGLKTIKPSTNTHRSSIIPSTSHLINPIVSMCASIIIPLVGGVNHAYASVTRDPSIILEKIAYIEQTKLPAVEESIQEQSITIAKAFTSVFDRMENDLVYAEELVNNGGDNSLDQASRIVNDIEEDLNILENQF